MLNGRRGTGEPGPVMTATVYLLHRPDGRSRRQHGDEGASRLRPHGMHMRLVCLRGLAKGLVTNMSGPPDLRRRAAAARPAGTKVLGRDDVGTHAGPDPCLTGMVRNHLSPWSSPRVLD